jgi:hypothetical protein
MGNKVKTIEIPAQEAVFWLDANGSWHNADGKFRHKKIIDYFHASIRRDDKGYHLYQAHEHYIEKVYFSYEDTVLFVFDVLSQTDIMLVLNTKKRARLRPRNLFVKNDSLYMHLGDEIIKFAEHGLMKIAPFLEEDDDQLFIRSKNRRYRISTLAEKAHLKSLGDLFGKI